VRHPRWGRGTRLQQFVQPIDFFPTICEALGVEPPGGLHGRSILPFLENPDAEDARDAVLFGEFAQACYLTDREYALVQGVHPSNPPLYSYSVIKSKWSSDDWGPFDGTRRRVGPRNADTAGTGRTRTRLYSLRDDPRQEHDIAAAAPDVLRSMQRRLVQKLREIDAPPELITRFGLEEVAAESS